MKNKLELLLQRRELYRYLNQYTRDLKTLSHKDFEHIKSMIKLGSELSDAIYDYDTMVMIYSKSMGDIVYQDEKYMLKIGNAPTYGKGFRLTEGSI